MVNISISKSVQRSNLWSTFMTFDFTSTHLQVAFRICFSSNEDIGPLNSVFQVLQRLANLRPEMILPDIVQRMKEALDIVTEPHKLKNAINAVNSVARVAIQWH